MNPLKSNLMRKLPILFFLLLLPAFIFSQNAVRDNVSNLLKQGNSTELSNYFISNIDLTLLDVDDVYSKQQAEVIIRQFFENVKPTAFTIKHEGKSKLDDYYYIGKLSTAKGVYRVTFLLKNKNDKFLIKQLRIEESEDDF